MPRFRRPLALLLILLFLPAAAPAASRVLLISIDGLRPDVALRADMPNLRNLMKQGSYTFFATTTPAAITLPSHTSMITGVTIERHGISGNTDEAAAKEKLLVPTIFDLAKAAGISTGMASGKSKFSIYTKPIDHWWVPKATVTGDTETGDHAVQIIHDFQPAMMFVHFGENDHIGHGIGWGSHEQLAGLANTDKQIGRIIELLHDMKLYDQTVILITADHGGSGRSHGANDDRSKFIPWIIEGPDVPHDVDLTLFRDLNLRTYDTFATLCHVLGLSPPEGIDGKVVTQAFTPKNLMQSGNATTAPAGPRTSQQSAASHEVEEAIFLILRQQQRTPVVQPSVPATFVYDRFPPTPTHNTAYLLNWATTQPDYSAAKLTLP